MMGTPAYGTHLATSLVAPEMSIPGDPTAGLIAAACWTVLYFGLAATLFGATLATSDRCLERIAKRRTTYEPNLAAVRPSRHGNRK
jgi:hypothetical protein